SLRPHLGCNQRRRRRADDARHLVSAADRIVRDRALGWPLLVPGLEVIELRVRRNVVALACRDLFLRHRARGQILQQAPGRGLVLGETPDAVEAWQDRVEATL